MSNGTSERRSLHYTGEFGATLADTRSLRLVTGVYQSSRGLTYDPWKSNELRGRSIVHGLHYLGTHKIDHPRTPLVLREI